MAISSRPASPELTALGDVLDLDVGVEVRCLRIGARLAGHSPERGANQRRAEDASWCVPRCPDHAKFRGCLPIMRQAHGWRGQTAVIQRRAEDYIAA